MNRAQVPVPGDASWVAQLVSLELPSSGAVHGVDPLTGSVTNRSYLVRCEGATDLVVKTCRESDWRHETAALALLMGHDVPVAPLLASGHDDGIAWLVLGHLPGGPARHDSARSQGGLVLRRVHELDVDAFGPLGEPFPSMRDALVAGLEADLSVVVAAGLLGDADAARVQEAVTGVPEYRGSPRLLHGDLKDLHLHSEAGVLVALLDWGDARGGDPAYDLARYSLEGSGALSALLRGYGPVALDAEAVRAYRLRFTLDSLATECRSGGDWFATYQERIARDITPSR